MFLATVMDKNENELNFKNITIVKEYPDVFSEELLGLPLNREIEFSIDLLPGSGPISKAPYRMAPADIRELMEQLQELVDTRFIRPRTSPGEPHYYLLKRRTGV